MSTPVQERPHVEDREGFDGAAARRSEKMSDAPPLLLAGTDDDGTEAHICRGID